MVVKPHCINRYSLKDPKKIVLFLLFTIHFFLIQGCSIPRIVFLDDPLTPEEHLKLGVIYERKGEIELAIEEYKKASKKMPLAYFYLGNAYFQKGDIHEAEKYYKKTIKKQPDLADAYNNLAWLYYTKVKDLDMNDENSEILKKAEGLVEKAFELNPVNDNYQDTLNRIRELRLRNKL